MQKQELNLKQYSQHANNVLAWLQTINKNSKSTTRQPLQQQLQSLSLSYKNAQQKLLALEKQLYYESLYNEKQRSIIEMLKYIINGNLDDETILTYLVQMQDESSNELDSKYQIKTQLQQIKQIVMKRKSNDKKAESLKCVAITDLKKELIKCNQVKKELMEDLDRILNQKGCIQIIMEETKVQFKREVENLRRTQAELAEMKKLALQMSESLKEWEKENTRKTSIIKQLQQEKQKMKLEISKFIGVEDLNGAVLSKMVQRLCEKIEKYRKIAKQMSDKLRKQKEMQDMVSAIRIFLPEQALQVLEEYQKNGQKCLLKELEGIAKLQKKKYNQLQVCQDEVWRLKQRLLREGSYLKSRKTGATQNKENNDPNNSKGFEKVTQFSIPQFNSNQF